MDRSKHFLFRSSFTTFYIVEAAIEDPSNFINHQTSCKMTMGRFEEALNWNRSEDVQNV